MQMQRTYWLEKVLIMISLYVNALLCIDVQGENFAFVFVEFPVESETYVHVGLRDGGPVFRAPHCT
jgi:hypothetical protein